jgi:hypothetical protein
MKNPPKRKKITIIWLSGASGEAPPIKLQASHVKAHQAVQQDHNPCCLIAVRNHMKYKQPTKMIIV